MSDQAAEALQAARAKLVRLQEAYGRVFGAGQATKQDKVLVIADLEDVCNVRRTHLRSTPHATHYVTGTFSVWQRINNMRFPRSADIPSTADFQVTIPRDGGGNVQTQTPQLPPAGGGVPEPTLD